MQRLFILLCLFSLSGCETNPAVSQWFGLGSQVARDMGYADQAELVNGVRQTLELSSERAATLLGSDGGYARAGYPITLPESVKPVTDTLRSVGMGGYVDKVETAMRDGAEAAAAEAVPVFQQAIRDMSVTDALGIIQGGEHAATDYFRGQTEASLRQRYQPVIQANLKKTGFYDQYQAMLKIYDSLPLTSKPNLDLEQAVLDQSLEGLYGRMATEEARIRQDPVAAGTALLGKLFQ